MKKILFLLIISCTLFLVGCTKDSTKIKIMIPSGAPTLGFVKMIHENEEIMDYKMDYEITSGPDLLVSAMTSKSHQIVIAPTNLGAKIYQSNESYQFAGTITFGNLYLVSNEEFSLNDLENETIYAFGKGGTPEILLKKVLEFNDLDNVNIEFLNGVDDVNVGFNAGTYSHVLLAEPVLSVVKSKKEVYIVSDLQTEYEIISGNNSYPQAGVFIDKDFINKNQKFVEKFLSELQDSINLVNNDKESIADMYISEELSPKFPKQVIIDSIPGSNISFMSSSDSKTIIEDYFKIIQDFNSNLIGGKLPDEEFYYD